MSSMLSPEEELARVHAPRSREPRTITITLELGQEALDKVIWPGLHPHSAMAGKLNMLAAAYLTMCAKLRDAQSEFKPPPGELCHTDLQRQRDLREAGRCAAIAMTEMEKSLHFAIKAAEYIGTTT